MSEGELKIWWVPQVPMKSFEVSVDSPEEGHKILTVLAAYDLFQYENNVKPDYSNAGGLVVFDDGEWCDWHGEDGEELEEYMERVISTTAS